jgi:WD40 repeat protein
MRWLLIAPGVQTHWPSENKGCSLPVSVKIYNIDGTIAKELHDHTNQVSSAEFSADGRFIVTCGVDGAVFVYETSEYKKVAELRP